MSEDMQDEGNAALQACQPRCILYEIILSRKQHERCKAHLCEYFRGNMRDGACHFWLYPPWQGLLGETAMHVNTQMRGKTCLHALSVHQEPE